ncbi:MAG: UvrD-helicase domain-containing protein [Pirellulales bacterium]
MLSLDSLTSVQRQAVEHIDGPQLILAGPGSGKTRVVTHRIANLLEHGIPPRSIVALTFTNKAAQEMRSRVAQLAPDRPVWISTFHRFCARLLREYAPLAGLEANFSIYDTDDSRRLLRIVLGEEQEAASLYTPERIAGAISAAKNRLATPEEYQPRPGSALQAVVARVFPRYQARLREANAVDFDDLLGHVAVLLRDNPEVRTSLDARFRYVLVDEYQDTNLAQYRILRALSVDAPNLSVTGDPDQSIYGWRGATISNILNFEKDYPGAQIVRLEQNYRSTPRILRVADALIANNVRRKEKRLFTENAEGPPVRLILYPTQSDEARDIAERIAAAVGAGQRQPRDFAIFYRVNALSRSLEIALREQGIPYQLVNSVEFYQRREIKDILAYLHLVNNPRNNVALLRIINTPARGIGRTTIERLASFADAERLSLLEAARRAGVVPGLSARAALAVAKFVSIVDAIGELREASVAELMKRSLDVSGYERMLRASDDEGDEDRLANIQELLTAARQFDEAHIEDGGLEAFLEQASLVSDTDSLEAGGDHVALMTMHSAKGLEFPVVFLIAAEHGILPHERSSQDPEQLEEERRLLFVAITRAKEEFQLSTARYRDFRGNFRLTVPSAFLMELPRAEMDFVEIAPAADQHHEDPEHVYRHEDTFDEPSFQPPSSKRRPATALANLKTAAEMTDAAPPGGVRSNPDALTQGMMVRHPEYGMGVVLATSGAGEKRVATIRFLLGAGEKRFVLAKSALQPVSAGEQQLQKKADETF